MSKTFSWGERFALINAHHPSEEEILQTFNVTQEEYTIAKNCIDDGVFKVSNSINVEEYANIFSDNTVSFNNQTFASKVKPVPKKRGRKGDKIPKAFNLIPTIPVPVEEFATEHGVSIHVLKQSKRFDVNGLGTVKVKKVQQEGDLTKTLMIWRAL